MDKGSGQTGTKLPHLAKIPGRLATIHNKYNGAKRRHVFPFWQKRMSTSAFCPQVISLQVTVSHPGIIDKREFTQDRRNLLKATADILAQNFYQGKTDWQPFYRFARQNQPK
jgi:hypothetical protein